MEGYLRVLRQKSQVRQKRFDLFNVNSTKSYYSPADFEILWIEVDGEIMTFFEEIDVGKQMPIRKRGQTLIRSFIIEIMDAYELGINCGLRISSPDRLYVTYFECENLLISNPWYSALINASMHFAHTEERVNDRKASYDLLGLEQSEPLSKSNISRAFKKRALSAHPDKGGNMALFDQVKKAQLTLLTILSEGIKWDSTNVVTYEAVLVKIAGPVGLGLDVRVDVWHKHFFVDSVDSQAQIISISEGFSIEKGDVLVSIDHDDCSSWPLSRLKARLGPMRVPVGSSTRITFKRSLVEGVDDDESSSDVVKYSDAPESSHSASVEAFNANPASAPSSTPEVPAESINNSQNRAGVGCNQCKHDSDSDDITFVVENPQNSHLEAKRVDGAEGKNVSQLDPATAQKSSEPSIDLGLLAGIQHEDVGEAKLSMNGAEANREDAGFLDYLWRLGTVESTVISSMTPTDSIPDESKSDGMSGSGSSSSTGHLTADSGSGLGDLFGLTEFLELLICGNPCGAFGTGGTAVSGDLGGGDEFDYRLPVAGTTSRHGANGDPDHDVPTPTGAASVNSAQRGISNHNPAVPSVPSAQPAQPAPPVSTSKPEEEFAV